jgi:hypothetical protein
MATLKSYNLKPWIRLRGTGAQRLPVFGDDPFLTRCALENSAFISGASNQTHALRTIIEKNDVVFGIFPEPEKSLGWDKYLIKGKAVLQKIAKQKETSEHSVTAVWCSRVEEAIGMALVFGDKRPKM